MWNKILSRCIVGGLAGALLSASVAADDEPPMGFDCVITPSRSVDLGSPVPGQIHQVLVDRSARVRAGQIVAELDSRLEEANLAIAEFRAQAETELKLRRSAYAIDRRTEKRLNSLAASKVASAHDRDRAARDARLSAWRLRLAHDDLQLFSLEKARAETALDRRRIRSPIDGVVVARLREPGEYVEDQALLRIVKLDPLHVEAILPMRLFGKVSPGMSAQVVAEYDAGQAYRATVELVDPMGDAGSGTFGVRLALPNPKGAIPAGLKCRVEIDTDGPLLSDAHGASEGRRQLAASAR